jgi:hypothetical protein
MGGQLTPEEARYYAYKVNVYDVLQGKHVLMTVEESLLDVKANHDCMDYGVTKEAFDLNKRMINKVMKANGYVPVVTRVGGKWEHEPINGAYFFRLKK